MNNKGYSAVLGVVLMVAITVTITATVYMYVSNIEESEIETITYNGTLLGVNTPFFGKYNIYIQNNNSIYSINFTNSHEYYCDSNFIECFIDKEVTLTFEKKGKKTYFKDINLI